MQRFTCVGPSRAQRTRFGEVPNYAEGLYALDHNLYAWMVPNGSWGEANAGLVVGDDVSLLIDTLWDVHYTRTMLAAMEPFLQEAPLHYVVNTHADGDHCWGNELVQHCEIITSQRSHQEALFVQPATELWIRRAARLVSLLCPLPPGKAGTWLYHLTAPYDFAGITPTPATRTFEQRLTLDVGGRTVELLEVGPVHTSGDLMVYVPDARTLFTGDILFIGSTPVMLAGPLENWLAVLDSIFGMDVDTIVPGHGAITNHEGVHQVKAYWEYIDDRVHTCYNAGMSARETASAIVLNTEYAKQPFADWDSPERIRTTVHTMYCHLQGRTKPTSLAEWLAVLWEQALLAYEMPHAKPAIMHQGCVRSSKSR